MYNYNIPYKKQSTRGILSYHDEIFCLLSIDATKEDKRLGRLINHSKTKANVVTKVVEVDGSPRLCLIAKRDIEIGEELQYDYGDRRKEAIELFPWLTK